MHPALYSWRDELAPTVVRLLAYLGGLAVLSIAAAQIFQSTPVMVSIKTASKPEWLAIERPFPAFALSIPEAAGAPDNYAVSRNIRGGGRKDVLSLGEPGGIAPYLEIEIYRPGREIRRFPDAASAIAERAADLAPVSEIRAEEPVESKFGPLSVFAFSTGTNPSRHCLAFVRSYDDPRLQLSGRFCQGGDFVDRGTLSCALDRLSLLAAGSEPKIGALFARAELRRNFCGQRNLLLAPTPKYRALWGKTAQH